MPPDTGPGVLPLAVTDELAALAETAVSRIEHGDGEFVVLELAPRLLELIVRMQAIEPPVDCDADTVDHVCRVACFMLRGAPPVPSPSPSRTLALRLLCRLGRTHASAALEASRHLLGRDVADIRAELLLRASRAGLADAHWAIAQLLMDGAPHATERIVHWVTRAADGGVAEARAWLIEYYADQNDATRAFECALRRST